MDLREIEFPVYQVDLREIDLLGVPKDNLENEQHHTLLCHQDFQDNRQGDRTTAPMNVKVVGHRAIDIDKTAFNAATFYPSGDVKQMRFIDVDNEPEIHLTQRQRVPPFTHLTMGRQQQLIAGESMQQQEEPKPIGQPIRVSGGGLEKLTNYSAYHFRGIHYKLEDTVLLAPLDKSALPYVAVIKVLPCWLCQWW
ncbi:hypothetical protein ACFE04_013232 [Oxalis oulophora]